MSASTDPPARHTHRMPTRSARQQSAPCPWCYGAGQYLEKMDVENVHAYLPLVCQGCMGSGKRDG